MLKGTSTPIRFLVFTTGLIILMGLLGKTEGVVARQDREKILGLDEKVITIKMDHTQNVQFHNMEDYLASKNLFTSSHKKKTTGDLSLLGSIDEFVLGPGERSRDQNWLISLRNVGTLKLEDAVDDGNGNLVKLLVRLGADVNEKNGLLETPLHRASCSADKAFAVKFSKFLIDSGADAYAQDKHNRTFLHNLVDKRITSNPAHPSLLNWAALSSSEFVDITNYLIEKDLSKLFNMREKALRKTPLMLAARNVELDVATISLLGTNGVDLSLMDGNGASYFSYAAEGTKNAKFLADLTRNGSIRLKHNNLSEAIKAMDGDSVKVLVRLGADVNERSNGSATPLHLAAQSKNKAFAINTIKFLIDFGADVFAVTNASYDGWNDPTTQGQTFLHILLVPVNGTLTSITATQFHDMVAFLISKDLFQLLNTPNDKLITPLHMGMLLVDIETVTLALLKNNGVEFNTLEAGEIPVLFMAALGFGNQTLRFMSDLIAFGADPNQLHDRNVSLLHIAAGRGNLALLKFLLNRGLDVNAEDTSGITPLHSALELVSLPGMPDKDVFKTVQFLLKNGANPEIVNSDNETPRDYFIERRENYSDADKISTCFSLGPAC